MELLTLELEGHRERREREVGHFMVLLQNKLSKTSHVGSKSTHIPPLHPNLIPHVPVQEAPPCIGKVHFNCSSVLEYHAAAFVLLEVLALGP